MDSKEPHATENLLSYLIYLPYGLALKPMASVWCIWYRMYQSLFLTKHFQIPLLIIIHSVGKQELNLKFEEHLLYMSCTYGT